MPPRKPKLVKPPVVNPEDSSFDTWDDLVSEAHVDRKPYVIKGTPEGDIEVGCPNGDNYLLLMEANKMLDAPGIFDALFPVRETPPEDWEPENEDDVWVDVEGLEKRAKMRRVFATADFPIYDILAARVIRHYFGVGMDPGKSKAS